MSKFDDLKGSLIFHPSNKLEFLLNLNKLGNEDFTNFFIS